jgi:hypothetical protein
VYTRDGDYRLEDCWTCKGTGRVEGLARSLAEQHPLTRVVLTDLQPSGGGENWFWGMLDLFPEFHAAVGQDHPTREAAVDALARATAAWARSLVPWLREVKSDAT